MRVKRGPCDNKATRQQNNSLSFLCCIYILSPPDTMRPPRIPLRPTPTAQAGSWKIRYVNPARSHSSSSRTIPRSRLRRLAPLVIFAGLTMSLIPSAHADSPPNPSSTQPSSIQSASTLTLLRSYFVYTLCSLPPLIDNAPSILHVFTHSPIPGLKSITEAVVRRTFFAQFVPGETVRECKATMEGLRKREVGSVLNYSAEAEAEEGDEVEQQRKVEEGRLREVERALDEAGEFERDVERSGGGRGSTAFALKVVGSASIRDLYCLGYS